MHCRYCQSTGGETVLDLGHQPQCDRFPSAGDPGPDPSYPLSMWFCRTCGLAQLADDAAAVEEKPSVSLQAMADLAVRNLDRLADAGLLPPSGTVAEFDSPHGDSWAPMLQARGLSVLPPKHPGPADFVADVYGLLHETDQRAALAERVTRLAEDATIAFQFHSLATVASHGQWQELRHGHYAYHSAPALAGALGDAGLGIHRAWLDDMEGGTLLVAARRRAAPNPATEQLLAAERSAGACEATTLRGLQDHADKGARALRAWLEAQRRDGRRVAGAAAASRAVPVLSHAGITRTLLAMVSDASPAKQGTRMPGTDIPIVAPEELVKSRPDYVVVFVPYLVPELRTALPQIEAAGGAWVTLDPEPRIV
jgi:hypothetical protein